MKRTSSQDIRNDRGYVVVKTSLDNVVVMCNPGLIYRAAAERKNPRPGDAEGIVRHLKRCKTRDVFDFAS